MNKDKLNLLNLSVDELTRLSLELGEKPYRGRQIAAWLFRNGAEEIEQMTDIGKDTRARLAGQATIKRLKVVEIAEDGEGGTRKILWELVDGQKIESVLIPEKDHYTLCLSSQVGCAMGCRFCRTGLMNFTRNLTSGEIIGQVLEAQKLLKEDERLTNLVFMGMGEPLLNVDELLKALNIITDSDLMGFSRKRVTISTVGIIPGLTRLAQEGPQVSLAVSLTAPTDDLRSDLMPINKKYPLAELKKILATFPLPSGRRLTIAYVLLSGVNDSEGEARKLSAFLTGLKVKINLIPFNPWPGAPFKSPPPRMVENFKTILTDKNHTVMVRWSKGRNVKAACGQLCAENEAR